MPCGGGGLPQGVAALKVKAGGGSAAVPVMVVMTSLLVLLLQMKLVEMGLETDALFLPP